MSRVLPILFNGDMVQAILEGRKTVTRRVIKFPVNSFTGMIPTADDVKVNTNTLWSEEVIFSERNVCLGVKPPYGIGDIMYVRETWAEWTGGYIYRAWPHPFPQPGCYPTTVWRPSIHMPKEAARIWLKVRNLKAERLKDISGHGLIDEGLFSPAELYQGMMRDKFSAFQRIWDSTIRKADIGRYGWDANPWVWVIKFEPYKINWEEAR